MTIPVSRVYEFGDFRLDGGRRVLTRRDGTPVPLTSRAYDTLLFLVEHNDAVLDKERLMEAVWPDSIVEENNLTQCVSTLRRIFGEAPGAHRFIVTVPGRGYRFVAEVKTVGGGEIRHAPAAQMDENETAVPAEAAPPPSSRKPLAYLLVAALLIGALSFGAFVFWRNRAQPTSAPAVKTIAVLPFKPLVPEARDQALELGMTETLIARLGNLNAITVQPLSSVRRYGDVEQDPLVAGRALDVQSVLDGTIQRWGDRIRVTARLVNVPNGASLWTDTFDESFTDVFRVEDAIAQRVTQALAVHLNATEQKRLIKRYTDNPAAYQLYLTGRYHWNRITPPEIRKSIENFRQAIELDPAYALAYGGLAEAYRALPITSDVPPHEAFPQAKAAAAKAIEIDDSLAEPHASLSFIHFWYDWDWANAEREAQRAVELNPNSSFAHIAYANLLCDLGRHDQAIAQGERARELEPVSLIINALDGALYYYAGRMDEAAARLQATLELEPNFWVAHLFLGKVLIEQAQYPEAIAELSEAREFSHGNSEAISMIGYAAALAGDTEKADASIEELTRLSARQYVPQDTLAAVYAALHRKDEAFAALERAIEQRDVRLSFLRVDP